jgi:uncharacterized membrane protein YciS (DUF1049 family)
VKTLDNYGKGNSAEIHRKREFVFYFLEQVGALLGTWMQQVVLGWLMHTAPVTLHSFSYVSPQLSSILTIGCSALTWLILTVWSFKVRERFRQFSRVVKILKSKMSTARRFSLLNWTSKQCCFASAQTACRG